MKKVKKEVKGFGSKKKVNEMVISSDEEYDEEGDDMEKNTELEGSKKKSRHSRRVIAR